MADDIHSSLKTVAKGTTLVFFSSALSMLLWFASKILIVNRITKEELGIYSLALSIVSMVSALASMGIPDGVTRYISIYLGEGKKEDADAVAKAAIKISGAIGLAASALVFFFSPLIARHFFYMPELVTPLRVVSAFIFFNTCITIFVGILRGFGNVTAQIYNINLIHPVIFLALAGVCFAFRLSFIFLMFAYLTAVMAVFLSIWIYSRKAINLKPLKLGNAGHAEELLRLSLPLLGASIMNMVFAWSDTFVLGRYAGADAVGVYSVSVTLAKLLTFVISAMVFTFLPIAGDLYSKGRHADMKRTYQVLTKWVFIGTIPIFFVLFCFPEMTITFLFGKQYMDSAFPLRVLSIGFMANVFFGASTIFLIVMGMSKSLLKIETFGAVLNLGLNYLLVKRMGYGVKGACSATAFSMCLIYGIYAFILYKKSRIHALTCNYVKPMISLGLVGAAVYALVKSLPLHLWMVPLYFVLFLALYSAALLLSRSIEKEDVVLFETVANKTGLELKFVRQLLAELSK
ncbi:MAG: flippase [Nitrospiraceae bacterium]|nr:flippase [Nitrospiraceae bacterium]